MNDNLDFKGLWSQQKIKQANSTDLLAKVSQLKKASITKLIFTNLILLITSFVIFLILYYYNPHLVTSKAGVILTIIAMVIYVFASNRTNLALRGIDSDQSNNEYLRNLVLFKKKQDFLQTKMLNLYFILLSTGICLYLYEQTLVMTKFWAIFIYSITFVWIAFVWLYVRPRTIRQQSNKIEVLIKQLEKVSSQLSNENQV